MAIRLRTRVLIVVFLLVLCVGGSVASAATTTTGIPLFPVNTGSDLRDYEKFDTWNYAWDPSGIMNQYDPLYMIGNLGMLFSAFIMRGAIFLLSVGLHPEIMADIFIVIVQVISSSPPIILKRIWPFVAVIATLLFIWDYQKGDHRKMMKRGISMVVVMVVLGLYYALSAPGLKLASDGIDAVATTFAGAVVQLAAPLNGEEGSTDNSDQFLAAEDSIYDMVWQITIEQPWQMGELGSIDARIGKHAGDVKYAISSDTEAMEVTEDTKWKEVFLKYPRGSDIRKELIDVYQKAEPNLFRVAFAGEYRLIIGFCTLLASVVVFLFFAVMGILLIALFLILLAMIIAGVVIIPFSLIPIFDNHGALRWLAKVLGFAAIGKIAIGIYVGIVFLVVIIFNKTNFSALFVDGNANGFLVTLFFNIFWYLAGLAFFIYLLYKLNAKTGWITNRKRKMRSSDGDYDDEDDYEESGDRRRKTKQRRKIKKVSTDFVEERATGSESRGRGASSDTVDVPNRDGGSKANAERQGQTKPAAGSGQTTGGGRSATEGSAASDSELTKTKSHPDVIPISNRDSRNPQHPGEEVQTESAPGTGTDHTDRREKPAGSGAAAPSDTSHTPAKDQSDTLSIPVREGSNHQHAGEERQRPDVSGQGPQSNQGGSVAGKAAAPSRDLEKDGSRRNTPAGNDVEKQRLTSDTVEIEKSSNRTDEKNARREEQSLKEAGVQKTTTPFEAISVPGRQSESDVTAGKQEVDKRSIEKDTPGGQPDPGDRESVKKETPGGHTQPGNTLNDEMSPGNGHESTGQREQSLESGTNVQGTESTKTSSPQLRIPQVEKKTAAPPTPSEQSNPGKVHEDRINVSTERVRQDRSDGNAPGSAREQVDSSTVQKPELKKPDSSGSKPAEDKKKKFPFKLPPLLRKEKNPVIQEQENRKNGKIHYD